MDAIKKVKLLLGIFIPFFAFFVMSQNTFALWTADYGVRTSSYVNNECVGDNYTENHSFGQWFSGCHILAIVPISSETTATGDTIIYSGKLNLVKELDAYGAGGWIRDMNLGIRSVYFGNIQLTLSQAPSINTYFTRWRDNINGVDTILETLTIAWSITVQNNTINNTTGRMRLTFYNNNYNGNFDEELWNNRSAYYYFENTGEDPTIIFVDTGSGGNNTIISQNNVVINQNEQIINQDREYYNHEYEAEDNISSQTSDDINGATNQQTTNLIGVISDFINVLRGNGTSTSNCNINLPFPSFLGGTQTVNVCVGRGNLQYGGVYYHLIFSRLFLICFFVPLIWILLRLIYNEIRSWTNG